MALSVTHNPAMLAHLLTDELYLVPEKGPASGAAGTAPETVPLPEEHLHKEPAGKLPAGHTENKPATLVLLDYPEEELAPGAELDYLGKILESVGLKREDVTILNVAVTPVEFGALRSSFHCTRLLVFGDLRERVGLPAGVNLYQTSDVHGISTLVSDRLDQLRPDVGKRKRLWTSLREMFIQQ